MDWNLCNPASESGTEPLRSLIPTQDTKARSVAYDFRSIIDTLSPRGERPGNQLSPVPLPMITMSHSSVEALLVEDGEGFSALGIELLSH